MKRMRKQFRTVAIVVLSAVFLIAGTSVPVSAGQDDAYVISYYQKQGYTQVNSTQEALETIQAMMNSYSADTMQICFDQDKVDENKIAAYVAQLRGQDGLQSYRQYQLRGMRYGGNENVYSLTLSWYSTPQEEAMVDATVAQIAPTLQGEDVYQTILNVHDYICSTVSYDYATYQGTADRFTAYDALFSHLAVCSGYASLFQKFMEYYGIPSYIASGNVVFSDGTGGPHAWNLVSVDGLWYRLDCTWDAQEGVVLHDYFLQGSDQVGYASWQGIPLSAVSLN